MQCNPLVLAASSKQGVTKLTLMLYLQTIMGHPVYTFNTGWLETVPKHTENSTKISQAKLSKVAKIAKIAKLNEKLNKMRMSGIKYLDVNPLFK